MGKFKKCFFLKAVSFLLILTVSGIDISWASPAVPDQSGKNLSVQSPFQEEMFTEKAESFRASMFSDARLLGDIINIAKYVFGDPLNGIKPLPLDYIEYALEVSGADLSGVVLEDNVLRIPRSGSGEIIEVAFRDTLDRDRLSSFDWLVMDRYLVKMGASSSESPSVKQGQGEEAVFSPDIASLDVELIEDYEEKTKKNKKAGIRAVFPGRMLSLEPFSALTVLIVLKEFVLAYPVLSAVVLTGALIAAVKIKNRLHRLLFPRSWHKTMMSVVMKNDPNKFIGNDALKNSAAKKRKQAIKTLLKKGALTDENLTHLIADRYIYPPDYELLALAFGDKFACSVRDHYSQRERNERRAKAKGYYDKVNWWQKNQLAVLGARGVDFTLEATPAVFYWPDEKETDDISIAHAWRVVKRGKAEIKTKQPAGDDALSGKAPDPVLLLEETHIKRFMGALIARARQLVMSSPEGKQRLLIALDLDWIPGKDDKTSLNRDIVNILTREIFSLEKKLAKMGLDNVKVISGKEEALAESVIQEVDSGGVLLSNVIIVADEFEMEANNVFRSVKQRKKRGQEGAFFVAVSTTMLNSVNVENKNAKVSDGTVLLPRIRLFEMLTLALEVASGKQNVYSDLLDRYDKENRVLYLFPHLDLVDYQELREEYMKYRDILRSA